MNLPEDFEKNMERMLQGDYKKYLESFEQPRLYGLRVNTLKMGVKDFLSKGLFSLEPVSWCPEGFYYAPEERPSKHPYYYAGLYYLQEPSAMAPGAVIDVQPGDKVLDLCAAPGGKSTQVGARLKGAGMLVSNDISPTRAKALLKNLELWGVKNYLVLSETPEKMAGRFLEFFDKILVLSLIHIYPVYKTKYCGTGI